MVLLPLGEKVVPMYFVFGLPIELIKRTAAAKDKAKWGAWIKGSPFYI